MVAISNIRLVIGFSWAYLRPYWIRLAIGVGLGIAFGIFNASFVWGTKTLFERLDPPNAKQEVVSSNHSIPKPFRSVFHRLKKYTDKTVELWLPKAGSELSIYQIAGWLLFLPVLV